MPVLPGGGMPVSPRDTPLQGDDARVGAGTVVLFADGLRFDVSQRWRRR